MTQELRVNPPVRRFILMRLFVPYDTSKDGTIFAKDAEKEVSLTEAPEFMVQLLSPIND